MQYGWMNVYFDAKIMQNAINLVKLNYVMFYQNILTTLYIKIIISLENVLRSRNKQQNDIHQILPTFVLFHFQAKDKRKKSMHACNAIMVVVSNVRDLIKGKKVKGKKKLKSITQSITMVKYISWFNKLKGTSSNVKCFTQISQLLG